MTTPPASTGPDAVPAALDPVELLRERFSAALAQHFGAPDADPMITGSRRADLGDFQSNAAMPLGKQLGKNPREVASELIAKLDLGDLAEPLDASSIAGPGFINIKLRSAALASLLEALDTPGLGLSGTTTPQTIVVDLVGVNLAKQMHVGHLRSMIVGDAIARTLERLGHRVIRQNHVGDWGLPIAMVTRALSEELDAGRMSLGSVSLDDLDRLYRFAQTRCAGDHRGLAAARKWNLGPKAIAELEAQVEEADEHLARAKQTLLELQARKPEVVRVWERIAEVTMGECLSVCARLGVAVTSDHSAGESSYAEELGELVNDLQRRNVVEESRGALLVRVEGLEQPCLVRKSDGGFLYATTDLCAIRRRVQSLGADRVIYCVDARQSLHFAQVFGAAIKAGYATKEGAGGPSSLEHAAFGMVLGEDHRPFKTRSGENVKLASLIEESDQRAGEIVREKNPELDDASRARIAHAVAIAAVKYADLSNDRIKDYVFSFERMLAFEGNTGPYLLYAVVRIHSIFRKAAERGVAFDPHAALLVHEPAERALALQLLKYPAAVRSVGDALEPHRLCTYLYELSSAFSAFFDACPVLAAEDEGVRASRLRLCDLARRVLTDGLACLGIDALERM
ncbi:MAG: arginine--tRNA ligase [Phycisphaerales bacterium JB037]